MTWARSKPLDPVSSALAFLLCSIAASIPCNPHAERAFYSFQCAYTPELCPLISTPQRSWIGKPGVLHVSLCRTPGFDSWVGKILWRRKWQTTPVLCLENLMEGEHGRLQSMGSQRVGHDWATLLYLLTYLLTYTPELCPLISSPQCSWTGKPGVLHVSLGLQTVGHD